jgi:protein subunit release factor B
VQLKHLPTGIVIKCQETRSRAQNREIARREMADRVEAVLRGEESRVAKKAREGARKRASRLKKSRRKYRKLAEGKEEGEEKTEGSGDGEKASELPT